MPKFLSREGQEIIKERQRVPASTTVDSPLNKFSYGTIDSVLVLDEAGKWERLRSEICRKGKAIEKKKTEYGGTLRRERLGRHLERAQSGGIRGGGSGRCRALARRLLLYRCSLHERGHMRRVDSLTLINPSCSLAAGVGSGSL